MKSREQLSAVGHNFMVLYAQLKDLIWIKEQWN